MLTLYKQTLQTYLEHRDEVRRILDGLSVKLPEYKSLEWRVDVQVASDQTDVRIGPCPKSQSLPNPLPISGCQSLAKAAS